MTLVMAAVMVVAVVLVAQSVRVARPKTVLVVERLGRFQRLAGEGLTILVPLLDRVRSTIPLHERTLAIPERQYEVRDGGRIGLSGELTYRVTDAAKATYAVASYEGALVSLVETTFADLARRGGVLDAPLAVREGLDRVRTAAAAWGLEVLTLQPLVTLTPEQEAEIDREVDREFDARVVAFAAERGEAAGPDGQPTRAQVEAYQRHLATLRESQEYREALLMGDELRQRQTGVATASERRGAEPPDAVSPVARQSIAAGATGIVEERGRMFAARNVSKHPIAPGERCSVDGQDGETLLVRGPKS